MADRRKDMWRLLYSVVNRDETGLYDVLVFVDDILCKEPSLIRHSLKANTNKFQDAFILWLVNKLLRSLNFEEGADGELFDKNLKVQRKLLNSCLVNRVVLFEKLLTAYLNAIDQLCEQYGKLNNSAEEVFLSTSAFSTEDHEALKEIDPAFGFPLIEINSDDLDDYVQAFLQVLHHGLQVGYVNFPKIFQKSLLVIFKALKLCDFPTKLLCLQYVGRVFERSFSLSELQWMYELTLRSLTTMWNYCPMWITNRCLLQDNLDDFIEESCSILKILYKFIPQIAERTLIERHCFQLMENLYEMHQWQGFQMEFDLSRLKEVAGTLTDFMFGLFMENLCSPPKIESKYGKAMMKYAEIFPFVLRGITPHLTRPTNKDELHVLVKHVETKITEAFTAKAEDKHSLTIVKEYLTFLYILEHLMRWREQDPNESTDLESLPTNETLQKSLFRDLPNFSPEPLKASLNLWLSTATKNTKSVDPNEVLVSGLMLQSISILDLLSANMQDKLMNIILKPLQNIDVSLREPQQELLTAAEVSLEVLAREQYLVSAETSKRIAHSLLHLGKRIFSERNESQHLAIIFAQNIPFYVLNNWLTLDVIAKDFAKHVKNENLFIPILKTLSCLNESNRQVVLIKYFRQVNKINGQEFPQLIETEIEITCGKCFIKSQENETLKDHYSQSMAIHSQSTLKSAKSLQTPIAPKMKQFLTQELFINSQLEFITNHLEFCRLVIGDNFLTSLFPEDGSKNQINMATVTPILSKCIADNPEFLKEISTCLLKHIIESLRSSSQSSPNQAHHQQTILEIITSCSESHLLSELWLFHFFKMLFFYLIHPESKVVHEAILCATELCSNYDKQPIQLWNWYKRDALNLIVKLMIYVYITRGVRMTRSLKAFTKMLGFSCVQEFICKYYRLLVTMILPYCVKEPRCKGLLISISKITRKPVNNLFIVSFLRIYTHIYLTEEPEIGNRCIELIGKCTGASLSKLMNTDVKQTVSEFLVYFNRSPTFVMQAFSCLLPNEVGGGTAGGASNTSLKSFKSPTHEFSNFIADRFLGVITYFQTCLSEPYFEKPLKEETLYSLGQIMRLIGPNNVTQFRFKIIAMLSFVLTLDDRNLQNICLKIWNIFLHTVNIGELGPSLSRIVASFQPLIESNTEEINDIYEFLILKSGSLLGAYISDLYFLKDRAKVRPAIRHSMARQTELLKSERDDIPEKLSFLYNQICNENSQVRIYGLNYLGVFINKYRMEINHMILDTIPLNPLIERIVDEVIKGCRHEDRNIHLASAKCLGEIGAIDPSYMSANFSFMDSTEISLSMHTDDFAIMALTELCRSYQFQKDSKYVDNFSLAIQETLAVFGISPRESKKLNVWEALPLRMQQIMEPLLTSCYTGSRRDKKISEHPLFNSSLCRSYDEWSFAWACRLIEWVQTDETRRLLNSYKPSMKRDSKMLSIFFPYILLHVLQECEAGKEEEIYEEFMAVFNFCNRDAALQGRVDVGGFKEFKSSKYSADRVNTVNGSSGDQLKKLSVGAASEQFEALETVTQTCTKLCSEQLDFLQRWIKEWQKQNMVGGKARQEDDKYKAIERFVRKFNKSVISKANYNSGEYARALLYLEEYIEEKPAKRLQEQLSYLIEIHGKLMDSDSVEGSVFVKETDLSLEEEILVNRLVDRPQETINCYQQLLLKREAQINQDHVSGIVQCYLRTDTPETALLITDGLWQKLADQYNDDYFKECKTELLWRLGRYDELQELLEDTAVKSKTSNWNIQCAESFLLFRQPPPQEHEDSCNLFIDQLDAIRSNIVASMRSCSGVTGNSYTHSYDEATRLHLLNEVEKNKLLINQIHKYLKSNSKESGQNLQNLKANCMQQLQQFFGNWDARLVILEPTSRVLEPVICFRRNLLLETQRILQQDADSSSFNNNSDLLTPINASINDQIVKLWLRSIQMNRESGCLQQAEISIMKVEPYKPATLFLEKAKLLWQKGDQSNCFKLLQDNINALEGHCNGEIRRLDPSKRIIYAEAKFLQASFNAESMNICSELNLQYFKEAVAANRTSEKCLLHYAQYMEKIYDSFTQDQKESDNGCSLLLDIMLFYAKSLKYGHSHVYQSLPRILSIWLDFTSQLASSTSSETSTTTSHQSASAHAAKITLFQSLAKKMNDMINNCNNMLPTSLFYTAFSQLLSRICHPSTDVFRNLCNIVIKLIEHFPHQSLWMLLPILKSCHTNRIKRSRSIFTDARLNKPGFQKLLNDFNILAERLIELTNKDIPFDRTYQLSTLVRQLPLLLSDPKFSNIMLPFEKYMQASFPITSAAAAESLNVSSVSVNPTPDVTLQSSSLPSYPFPAGVFICGISEEVVVLRSAAKPKKITIECSDGNTYNVMVKPKDDLRKDFRLMEFNGLVKRYLHQDPQARHRHLRIRTYAAIPFNEECGLVEWLPNLNSFRGICTSIYRMRGSGIQDRNIRQYALPKTDPIEKKRAIFQELLAQNPPVFHEWFRQRFHSPHSWYQARSSYVKTTSVMSMVGYILGLGDRHGENILFDETNGDAVHVDFNCLFNQGESFAYPELVPFRLTHNMTFAMGPLAVEGLFRKCCEITLRLLKGESKTLMSVLRPFVYDIGFIDRLKTKKTNSSLEVTDPKAITDVKRIEERLQGYVKRTQGFSIPLSTEGHVNFLITEATDLDNLASMYIGWGSYI